MFDREHGLAVDQGYYEVLFTNTSGEVTEGGLTNLFIRSGDRLLTPPVSCSLLASTYRRMLLEQGSPECSLSLWVREKVQKMLSEIEKAGPEGPAFEQQRGVESHRRIISDDFVVSRSLSTMLLEKIFLMSDCFPPIHRATIPSREEAVT